MQIVRDLGGYSLGRSDLVRRAMSKKKHDVMEKERKNFIYGIVDESGNIEVPGAIRNGVDEKVANDIFDQMMDFASYAFNKSHAAAYAVIGYETAYLKRYYPVEFFAAMLTSVMGNNDKVAFYIQSCKFMGMEVLPPDINESNINFTVVNGKVRFGLAAIKNVGKSAIISIINSRNKKGKFVSFTDFCQKALDSNLNKRAVESLIKAGAFDSLGLYRSQLLAVYEQVMDGISNDKKRNIDGQMSLFDMANSGMESKKDNLPKIEEFDKKYLLAMEKEMTGLYLSGHPLSEYKDELDLYTTINTSEIMASTSNSVDDVPDASDNSPINTVDLDNKTVTIGGIISSVKIKATKSNKIMAFITVEDMFGSIEVIVFPKVYERFNKLIQEDNICLIRGRISMREDEDAKILAEQIKPLKKMNGNKLYLKIQEKDYNEMLSKIKPILSYNKGQTPVYLCIEGENKEMNVEIASKDLWVYADKELILKLSNLLGEKCVKVC